MDARTRVIRSRPNSAPTISIKKAHWLLQVNPKKASSGCQFYIVQGSVLDENTLNSYEQRSGVKFTDLQRQTYTTIGGAPWLDGGYTVFGEVVTGFDVVDKIAAVPRDPGDKPLTPLTMTIEILE